MNKVSPLLIDQLLPQTQCGLCGYGGCLPYAKALAEDAAPINLCPPGGVTTLINLGKLLNKDAAPYVKEMELKTKPTLRAVIREKECIGCTKCITACPVDAIMGAAKKMHTVIAQECTGCELCIPACPVDCIDLIASEAITKTRSDHFRKRFEARENRLSQTDANKPIPASTEEKRNYVMEALERAKRAKK